MVEIRIVVEGGVLESSNHSVLTVNNSEKLREGFYKLFSQIIDPSAFNLIVELGAGYKSASNIFKKHTISNSKTSLLIDLDGPKSKKETRLDELNITEYKTRVFFMVQEMEAWILSQPDILDKFYSSRFIREKITKKIIDDELFQGHSEDISKPSEKLKVLLGRYFSEMKGNVKKKKKYGRLKDGPILLAELDPFKLVEIFEDFKLLNEYLS